MSKTAAVNALPDLLDALDAAEKDRDAWQEQAHKAVRRAEVAEKRAEEERAKVLEAQGVADRLSERLAEIEFADYCEARGIEPNEEAIAAIVPGIAPAPTLFEAARSMPSGVLVSPMPRDRPHRPDCRGVPCACDCTPNETEALRADLAEANGALAVGRQALAACVASENALRAELAEETAEANGALAMLREQLALSVGRENAADAKAASALAQGARLRTALEGILRIADRKHDAWDAAHAALSSESSGWVALSPEKAGQIARLLERLRVGIWGATADDITAALALLGRGR